MNSNEKLVQRVGVVLCAAAFLAAAPLVWAATRPVTPPPAPAWSEEAPKAARKAAPPEADPIPVVRVEDLPKAAPAPRKAAPAPKPAKRWTCHKRETIAGWDHARNRPIRLADPGVVEICAWD